MSYVFISYKSDDREHAARIALALAAEGLEVWWDQLTRAGELWDEEIERRLDEAGAVLVLWSPRAVRSKWVRAEARRGEAKRALVSVMIERCALPLEFSGVQSPDLSDPHPSRWAAVVEDLRRKLASAHAGLVPAAVRWNEATASAFATLAVIGFKSPVEVEIDQAFVPLQLHGRAHGALDAELGTSSGDWTLEQAIAHAEGLHGRRGVVVIGEPGCGKTTLLKYAWMTAYRSGSSAVGFTRGDLTPLFLRVVHVDPRDPPAIVLEEALKRALDVQRCAGAEVSLLRGPVLWLLDGLDEAGSAAHRAEVSRRLQEAIKARPQDRFVLTSRYAGWRDVQDVWAQQLQPYDVLGLSDGAMERFVRRWHDAVYVARVGRDGDEVRAAASRKADELLGKLRSREWIDSRRDRMKQNPLLLSVLCKMHLDGEGRLPDRRAELYQHLLHTLMVEQPRQAGADARPGMPFAPTSALLGAVAWHTQDHKDADARVFTTDEAAAWMAEVRDRVEWPEPGGVPGAEALLRRAEHDCGVVEAQGLDGAAWQFSHLTFQEWLAAYHAAAQADGELRLLDRLGQDRWREPVLLAMAMKGLPKRLFRRVVEERRVDLTDPDVHPLVAACLREATDVDWGVFAAALRAARDAGTDDALGWGSAVATLLADARAPGEVAALAREVEAAWARRASGGGWTVEDWTWEEVGLTFVHVPAGEFWMGAQRRDPEGPGYDPEAYDDEAPVRRVRISRPLWLGQHPVTNEQYRRFVEATGYAAPGSFRRQGFDRPRQPVTEVSWEDARAYARWLSGQLGAGWIAGLPTEAEWEWAARGVDGRRYPWGDDPPDPPRAVFGGAPLQDVGGRPAGAGPFGAHDQAGQVFEWCRDEYARYPTLGAAAVRPTPSGATAARSTGWSGWFGRLFGRSSGASTVSTGRSTPPPRVDTDVDIDPGREVDGAASRVIRGGSWGSGARGLRAACRGRDDPGDRLDDLGFRVCVFREHGDRASDLDMASPGLGRP